MIASEKTEKTRMQYCITDDDLIWGKDLNRSSFNRVDIELIGRLLRQPDDYDVVWVIRGRELAAFISKALGVEVGVHLGPAPKLAQYVIKYRVWVWKNHIRFRV